MSIEQSVCGAHESAWYKSGHSAGDGQQRAEIAVAWRKSSYSSGEGGECVEVADGPQAVYVRDSKDIAGPILTLDRATWARFVAFAAEQRC